MDREFDVVIIGGGAAGLSAALTLGRACRRVLVIDAGEPRNRFAAHMHGVLGHEGRAPLDLLELGRAELNAYDVTVRSGLVENVSDGPGTVKVTLSDDTVLTARTLIVASGISDDLPDIPGLAERWGKTVLHCPYCHGWEVRGKRLGVLTTSPVGMHQAELLRQWSDRLVVFTAGLGELSDEAITRLRSRGVELVDSPVTELQGEPGDPITVRTADGRSVEVDAIFTVGAARPHDEFLASLELERAENPLGSFLAVDQTGKTSHERIWAVGNVVNPGANVPISVGAASFAAGMVNMVLVTEDFDHATSSASWPEIAPVDFWEDRYAGSERIWSGRVNATVADVTAELKPGRSLDLGCGEGADAIWLARNGWQATGIDISATAIARAKTAAHEAGLSENRATFIAANLADLDHDTTYDLVTASFFHSPVELPRTEILRRAAEFVSPDGHLLITSHGAPPPWADASAHDHKFLTAADELAELDLSDDDWDVVRAEQRHRGATAPDGTPAQLEDSVVLLRRKSKRN